MRKISLETLEIKNTKDYGYYILYSANNRNNNNFFGHKVMANPITREQSTLLDGQLFEENGKVILVPSTYKNIRQFQENYLLDNWIFVEDPYFKQKEQGITDGTYNVNNRLSQDDIDKFNNIQSSKSKLNTNNGNNKVRLSRDNTFTNTSKGGYDKFHGPNGKSIHPNKFDQNTEYVPKAHYDVVVNSIKSKYDALLNEVYNKIDDITNTSYELKKMIKDKK